MSFPDLVSRSGGTIHAEATGVPANGNNTFALGIDPKDVVEAWLTVIVIALDEFVTNCTYVGLTNGNSQVTIDFEQTGVGQCMVIARIEHSIVR